MDPVATGIGVAALALSIYNAVQATRKDRRDAARDVANLDLAVRNIEDHTGEVYGVVVHVSNAGHRSIQIRSYGVSDRHNDVVNIAASGICELPVMLSDGQGIDFSFDLDDLQEASQRSQTMPEIFNVTDGRGNVYTIELPSWAS
jgi:hypothetical protein